jgi:hypothetical protein
MAKVTIVFGAVLILLGAWGFIGTGEAHPTALIPAYFGLVIGWSGFLAISPSEGRRKLWMHVAVTAGLLGFLGAAVMATVETVKAHGGPLAHPVAVEAQIAMAVVCAIFVGLCVRSFIAARRGGKLGA